MNLIRFRPVLILAFGTIFLGSCVVEEVNVCKENAKVCVSGSSYEPNFKEKAEISLEEIEAVVSDDEFKVTGSCAPLSSTVSIDIDRDLVATSGFSDDLFECECKASGLACPTISVDRDAYGADDFSVFATLKTPYKREKTTELSTSVKILALTLNAPSQIDDGDTLTLTGSCSPSGATISIQAPSGFSPASQSCSCSANALSGCSVLTESSSTLNTQVAVSATLTYGSSTVDSTAQTLVYNAAPTAVSAQTGVGYSYQASQLGGLSFIRYGNQPGSNPLNLVGHRELSDFVDDPYGNADGIREDGSEAVRDYAASHNTEDGGIRGWSQSASIDKYADINGKITPKPGAAQSGDVYRGYFVPSTDGIYTFSNTVSPDNSVRILMSPNECPKDMQAVLSADWAASKGAVNPDSTWILNKNGQWVGSNMFKHDTSAFFPSGSGNAQYAHGDVYLVAGNIYYLEIRYGEGGGAANFGFGIARRDFDGQNQSGATNLLASTMLPYSGSDAYVSRQACGGSTYDASTLFSDAEGDDLIYSAYLVTSGGSAIAGTAGTLAHLGLSLDETTGILTGTPNGNYTDQKIVFRAKDPSGSNTWVNSPAIEIIGN